MSKNRPSDCSPAPTLVSFQPPPHLRRRIVQNVGTEPSMTRQEFKDDCDINRILRKFQLTGALSHFAKYGPSYLDVTINDFQEAQNLMIRARQMFDALPSAVRKEVATPEGFLAFVSNPANADRMAELGLRNPTKTDPPIPPAPPATPPAG